MFSGILIVLVGLLAVAFVIELVGDISSTTIAPLLTGIPALILGGIAIMILSTVAMIGHR